MSSDLMDLFMKEQRQIRRAAGLVDIEQSSSLQPTINPLTVQAHTPTNRVERLRAAARRHQHDLMRGKGTPKLGGAGISRKNDIDNRMV